MIKSLEIGGIGLFRKRRKFGFKRGLNVIVGKNASGKTTILHTISLLSGKEPLVMSVPTSKWPKEGQFAMSAIMETSKGRCVLDARKTRGRIECRLYLAGTEKVGYYDGEFGFGRESSENPNPMLPSFLEGGKIAVIDGYNALRSEHQIRLAKACSKNTRCQVIAATTEWHGKGANVIEL